jgi:hypothetical protein
MVESFGLGFDALFLGSGDGFQDPRQSLPKSGKYGIMGYFYGGHGTRRLGESFLIRN